MKNTPVEAVVARPEQQGHLCRPRKSRPINNANFQFLLTSNHQN